jgi:DNA-binding phage protein
MEEALATDDPAFIASALGTIIRVMDALCLKLTVASARPEHI